LPTLPLTHGQLFVLVLTLGAYAIGVAIQRAAHRSALLNPTLLAIGIVTTALWLLKLDYGTYFSAGALSAWPHGRGAGRANVSAWRSDPRTRL
jgi:putative effector of murein hydrolase